MSLVIGGPQTLVAAAWDVADIGSAVFGGYAQEYQALRTRALIRSSPRLVDGFEC